MRLLIISDTHLPRCARDLPDQVWEEVDRADVVIRWGLVRSRLAAFLQARAERLIGVYGNNDGPELRERPRWRVRTWRRALRGRSRDRAAKGEEAVREAFPNVDMLVFGHSHIPWDTRAEAGLRLLNPGSPTDRRRQPHHTYMTAQIEDGRLDVRLHRVESGH